MSEIADISPDGCDDGPLTDVAGQIERGEIVAYAIVSIAPDGTVGTGWSIAGGRSALVGRALVGALATMQARLLREAV